MRPWIPTASISFALLLFAAAAAAQTPSSKDRAAARQHFAAGKKLYDAGKYPEAIAEFEQAQQLAPNPKVIFNIAQAYRLMGDKPKAKASYEQYLARESTGAVAEEARGHLATLDAELRAEEEAKAKAAAAEQQRREEEARKQAEAEERTRREAEEAQRREQAAQEEAARRRQAEERVRPQPAPAPPAAATSSGRRPSTLQLVMRWGGLAIGVLGGVTLIYGIYEGTEAKRIEDDLRADVMQLGYYPDDVRERMREGNRADARFLFGTIAGGLALVGGGVLFYIAGGLDLEPQVSDNGMGALLRVRF
jgi:tetratricopeptide (TPR) repeat protein